MAISCLLHLLGNDALRRPHQFLEGIGGIELDLITKQIEKRINTPLTSSAGRLFDAVSALLAIRNEVDYEGQAAIELEMTATRESEQRRSYPFAIIEQNGIRQVKLREVFTGILEDLTRGIAKAEIAATFHHTVSEMIVRMCQLFSQETGIGQVVLSGGVFQNRLLLQLTRRKLEEAGIKALTHKTVPCNDGGISLGQAVIAHFITE